MDDDDNLPYVSSVDAFAPEKAAPSVDAPDEKALERLMRVMVEEFELYSTTAGVKKFKPELPLEMRFELCEHYQEFLLRLSKLVNNAIDGIKEKNPNGRQ